MIVLLTGLGGAAEVVIGQSTPTEREGKEVIIEQASVASLITDTNATTECGDAEFLRGDGTCQTMVVGGDFSFTDFQNSFNINVSELEHLTSTQLNATYALLGAGGNNPFDQDLNTTNNAIFNSINITGNTSVQNLDVNGNITLGQDTQIKEEKTGTYIKMNNGNIMVVLKR